MEFTFLELRPRPKKDGLHDSGYRFIALTGVTEDGERVPLGQWHDHVWAECPTNIDVTEDGVIRIMSRTPSCTFTADADGQWHSSCMIGKDGEIR